MNILDIVKGWFHSPRYKIIHDPECGYCACWRNEYGSWQALDGRGHDGLYTDSDLLTGLCRYEYFVEAVEKAGKRVNLHATNRGRTIVWTEPTT
jgi:hypothetical protein